MSSQIVPQAFLNVINNTTEQTPMPTEHITPAKVRHNAFTENLGTDFVAVDPQGNVLARSDNEEGARRAAPDAAAFFTGKDFGKPMVDGSAFDHDGDGKPGGRAPNKTAAVETTAEPEQAEEPPEPEAEEPKADDKPARKPRAKK